VRERHTVKKKRTEIHIHRQRGTHKLRDTGRREEWQLIPVFLPGKFHGWWSLAGYSPWGHKELDTTE